MFELPSRDFGGYIFDCDGTLADSMLVHHQAWVDVLRLEGATFDFGWELFVSRAGMSLPATVAELNAQFAHALDAERVVSGQRAAYERLLSTVQPIHEVVELARRVALTKPVAVASGGERAVVTRTLEILGLGALFPVVVTAEDVTHGKPAPDLFLLAAERMGVPAADCVVFEDSVLGVLAAERAGMTPVFVRSNERRELAPARR